MGKKSKKKSKVKRKEKEREKMKAYLRKEKKRKIKPSVSKKDAKKLKKVILKRSELPELKSVRRRCNHHDSKGMAFIALADVDQEMRRNIKNLDSMIEVFSAEAIGVCSTCLTAVPSMEELTPATVEHARLMILGAAEHVVSTMKDEKEIKSVHKAMEDLVESFAFISKKYKKYYEANFDDAETTTTSKKGINYADLHQ